MLKSACLGEQLGASDDLGYVYVVATYGTETPFKIHTPTKFTLEVSLAASPPIER
jgi:hypothetical protein